MSAPAGWTVTAQVPGVVDEPTGRVGDLTLFHKTLGAERPDPFSAAMPGAPWARVVARAYRDDGCVSEDVQAIGLEVA